MKAFVCAALLLSSSHAILAGPIYRDVPYSAIPAGTDANLLSLDVYLPDGTAQARPIMIYVHGGSWQNGDKRNVGAKAQSFNANGFVLVSTNYRLSPQVQFPTHAQDLGAAIAYVKSMATSVGGDPTQIYLMGHSAGAHLVSLVATDPRYLAAHGMHPREINAVISLDTQAYDLNYLRAQNGGFLSAAYTDIFGTTPVQLAFGSPQTYVTPIAGIAPIVAAYSRGISGNELAQRRAQAEHFVNALTQTRNLTGLIPSPQQDHNQINESFGTPGDAVTTSSYNFLAQAGFYRSRGLWYDPARPGHGFDLQFAGSRLAGVFYTYDEDGSPSWLVLDGAALNGASATAQLLRYRRVNGVAILDRVSGNIELKHGASASDCVGNPLAQSAPQRIRARWTIDGRAGDWCLVPLLLANTAPYPSTNGIWYAGAADSGWGMSIAARSDATAGVSAQTIYHYDAAGAPRWSLAQSSFAQLQQTQPLLRYQGYCRSCAPTPLIASPAGEIATSSLLQAPRTQFRATSADGSSFVRNSPLELLTDPVR